MKKLFVFALCALLAFAAGCGRQPAADRPHIELIAKSSQTNFWKACFAGAQAAGNEFNVDVSIVFPPAEEDYRAQNNIIDDAVEKGVDAIVFSACDYNGSTDAVEKAIAAGVPIISIDSEVNSRNVMVKISTDNYMAGRMAAEAMIAATGGMARIGIVNFAQGSANGQQRQQGFMDRIHGEPGMQVLVVRNTLSNLESSKQATEQIVQLYPDLNAIVTFNEWTTLGVGYAIDGLGLGGRIKVVGFDNNITSIQQLEDGVLAALIVQNPFAMGYLGVQYALSAAQEGNASAGHVDTGTVTITRDNMYEPQNQKLLFPFS